MELGMYAENMISNYENPSNKHSIKEPTAKAHEENISCGDRIDVYLKIEANKVKEMSFEGSGCVISMGTANMLSDEARGKSLAEIERMGREQLLKIISIDPGPVRMHCATLSLRALKRAVFGFEKKPVDEATKDL